MTKKLTGVQRESADVGDDEVTHFWDCNPELAYCGTKLPPDPDADDEPYDDSEDPDDCAMCVMIQNEGLPRVCCGY